MKYSTLMIGLLLMLACSKEQKAQNIDQSDKVIEVASQGQEIATFASGCFWCSEEVFEELKGVKEVVSGYAGGDEKNPTYKEVGAGRTGHAEAVQIFYDPSVISYSKLLEVFFATHDPTTLNRQGPDEGKQYRSVVFYHDSKQKQFTEDYMNELDKSGKFKDKIVTQLVPFKAFYKAEEYHQNYFKLNPNDSYIITVTTPKVEKFRKQFKNDLK